MHTIHALQLRFSTLFLTCTLLLLLAIIGCDSEADLSTGETVDPHAAVAAGFVASGEVTGLAAILGPRQITLTWTDPTTDEFDHIEIIQTPGDDPARIVDRGIETFTAGNLANGKKYTFTIHTVDMAGNLSLGTAISATPPESWVQEAYLTASNADPDDRFGHAVAIAGNTIVVGACPESSGATTIDNRNGSASPDNSAPEAGAAYVFRRNAAGEWYQDAYLKAANAAAGDLFGVSVAIAGETVVVGASHEDSAEITIDNSDGGAGSDDSRTFSGAAYVFRRNASGAWVQDAYLKPSNPDFTDEFGSAVAIAGNTIVIGAAHEDSGATTITNEDGVASEDESTPAAGAAYVFTRDGAGAWIQDAYLKAWNAGAGDQFGSAIAIRGNTIVIGASREDGCAAVITNDDAPAPDDDGCTDAGAAYVFARNTAGDWVRDGYLKGASPRSGNHFGASLSMAEGEIAIGSYCGTSGGIAIINRSGAGSWRIAASLEAPLASPDDCPGWSLSLSGATMVAATPAGAAFVFRKDASGSWSSEATLTPSSREAGDHFGSAAAAAGDAIVIGSDGASGTGAVYVFRFQ